MCCWERAQRLTSESPAVTWKGGSEREVATSSADTVRVNGPGQRETSDVIIQWNTYGRSSSRVGSEAPAFLFGTEAFAWASRATVTSALPTCFFFPRLPARCSSSSTSIWTSSYTDSSLDPSSCSGASGSYSDPVPLLSGSRLAFFSKEASSSRMSRPSSRLGVSESSESEHLNEKDRQVSDSRHYLHVTHWFVEAP